MPANDHTTVAVVGVGAVGSTTAFSLVTHGVASELILVDVDEARATGEAMDLNHGAYFAPPVDVRTGDYEDCWDADVVVVTAGASQQDGETRLDLLERNADIFEEMIPAITEGMADDGVLLVVTNPVDVLTQLTWELSELPAEQVIGSGTTLDTSRFRHVLGERCDVDANHIHGYVVGEHGDSEVPLWSSTTVAGLPVDDYLAQHGEPFAEGEKADIAETVRNAAYEVIDRKGATNYAIALAATDIVEAVVRDEEVVLPVSTRMTGQYGLEDVFLSLPCVLDRGGVREVIEPTLSASERDALEESAAVLRESRAALEE
ncbi:L-lactate dehydrogenase [Halogranum gelatinilyticum]|uniref:L-lactate dehydrogenase n=1 Tax=Halogranum gelatinilyticum TaxID=660521 RepID=A0A1G9URR3_9EURY|nr:L-lactate dehydrogenase [Halogranum gelatinilyticum]SDM62651.1 L-lactate dehydrogenase [Halogranum gelatinilyticum]